MIFLCREKKLGEDRKDKCPYFLPHAPSLNILVAEDGAAGADTRRQPVTTCGRWRRKTLL
jgi:hypothetical protein